MALKCFRCGKKVSDRLYPVRTRGAGWSHVIYDVCTSCYADYRRLIEVWIRGITIGNAEPEEDQDEILHD